MPGPVSRSSYDWKSEEKPIVTGNPNPGRFRIDRHEEIGDYIILLVVYPDCKNYEGKKVMVFKDLKWRQVNRFKSIDPHFSQNKDFISPIARFEPTIVGWKYAQVFCETITKMQE